MGTMLPAMQDAWMLVSTCLDISMHVNHCQRHLDLYISVSDVGIHKLDLTIFSHTGVTG